MTGTAPAAPDRAAGRRPTRRTLFMVAGVLVLVLASVLLRDAFPILAAGDAVDDDALFVRLARSIDEGCWLGPYDELTFVKGMFYPLFIASVHLIGLPLKTAEQCVDLAAAGVVAFAVARAGRAGLALLLFACLAFNPVFWNPALARVIREGLYVGQTAAVIGLCAFLVAPALVEMRRTRRQMMLGMIAGLVLGSFWLTREEGDWLLPSLFAMSVAALIAHGRPGSPRRHADRTALLLGVVVACATSIAAVGGVALVNDLRYGRLITVDVRNPGFLAAYGAISRIRHDHDQRYVVFPADARRRAYAVSPAARELRPSLDGPSGAQWRRIGCAQTGTTPCPEILAGWFQWALRDAVATAGHYRTLPDTIGFYRRLAVEIDEACDRGAISCLPRRATLAPPFRTRDLLRAWSVAPIELRLVLDLGASDIGSLPSEGSAARLASFRALVGPIAPVSASTARAPVRHAIARVIGQVEKTATTVLLVPGLLGLLLCFARRPCAAGRSPVALLVLGSAVGVAMRVGLLAYLDATAIPSRSTLYASPATPLAIIVGVLGTALLVDEWRQTRAGTSVT